MAARLLLVLVPLCVLAGSAPAVAQERSVTAVGSGLARVRPADRHDNASIRKAVQVAKAKAMPRALAAARKDAVALASGTGLTLGEIIAVAETPPPAFLFYDDSAGSFGPGRYCGRIRTSVVRHVNGQRRRVIRSRRVCRFPSEITSTVSVTYAASGPAA